MELRKKRGDIIAGMVFVLLGIGVCVEAVRLRLGTVTEPQPGFFPFLSGVFLTGLAGILLFQAFRGLSTGTHPFKFWGPPAIVVGALCAYVAIFDIVGYVLATIPLGMVVLYVLDTKNWKILLVTSLSISLATYILFDKILGVPLHNGVLSLFF